MKASLSLAKNLYIRRLHLRVKARHRHVKVILKIILLKLKLFLSTHLYLGNFLSLLILSSNADSWGWTSSI
jgi:hypothetical protein